MSIDNASFQCTDHCGCMRSSFHNHKQLNSLVHAACAWLLRSIVQQQPHCIPLPKRSVRRMHDATRTWHFIITFHIRCPSHCAFVIAMYSRQSSMTCLLTQREHETRAAGGPLPNRQPSSTLTIGRLGTTLSGQCIDCTRGCTFRHCFLKVHALLLLFAFNTLMCACNVYPDVFFWVHI